MPRSQQPPPGDDDVVDRQVTFALRRLPTEIPVPDDVADRIAQALAAEAADVASGPSPSAHRWYRRPASLLAVAATVGIIGLAGASVLNNVTGGGSATTSESAADAGAGRDEAAASALAPTDAFEQRSGEESALSAGPTAAADSYASSTLADRVLEVWESAPPDPGSCGVDLAAQVGGTLVGSTDVGSDVLVVVESPDADTLQGWLIPTCTDLPAAAIDHVTTPTPDR